MKCRLGKLKPEKCCLDCESKNTCPAYKKCKDCEILESVKARIMEEFSCSE